MNVLTYAYVVSNIWHSKLNTFSNNMFILFDFSFKMAEFELPNQNRFYFLPCFLHSGLSQV